VKVAGGRRIALLVLVAQWAKPGSPLFGQANGLSTAVSSPY